MSAVVEEKIERRHYAIAGVRAMCEAALVVLVYFLVPLAHHKRSFVVLRIALGLTVFVVTLVVELRAIIRSRRPMLRAAVALALVLPVFLVVFAWTYLTMSLSTPRAFGGELTHVSALYFTVTVFSTVGFGDITAKSDAARLAVTAQMLLDLAVVAGVVRLIFGAARSSSAPD